jgi:flagellin
MRVNNNISAQNSYRNLYNTNNRLSKSMEKLSSGLRINRAADDAAGLGVSEKIRAQVSGLAQAINNSEDSISLIQTAEGALDRTHSILRRIRDLTIASSNGDKTDSDRASYQAEIDQLTDEIDRISSTTEYNTKKLLSGALGANFTQDISKLNATAGGTANTDLLKSSSVTGNVPKTGVYTIELNTDLDTTVDKVANTQYAAIESIAADNAATWEGTDTLYEVFDMSAAGGETETLTFAQPSTGKEVSVTLSDGDTINDAVKKMQDALDSQGFKIDVKWDTTGGGGNGSFQFEAQERGSLYNFFVSGVNSDGAEKIAGTDANNGDVTEDTDNDGIYDEGNGAGLDAMVDRSDDLQVIVYDPNGSQTTVTSQSSTFSTDLSTQDTNRLVDDTGTSQGVVGIKFTLDVDDVSTSWLANDIHAGIDVSGVLSFQAGANNGLDHRIAIGIDDMSSQALGVKGLDVSDQSSAQSLLDSGRIDEAISKVSNTRGNLGAVQNRLEHTIQNLSVTRENLAAAESRIRDTDIASEMMEFTRNQIMQQAGTAMLSQANLTNQTVLQLLG